MEVKVISTNDKVWNFAEVCTTIATAKSSNEELVLDLNSEGPDFETLGLLDIIDGYPTKVINCQNTVQKNLPGIEICVDSHNKTLNLTRNSLKHINITKKITTAFGMFIGRSNVHRLFLSGYVYANTESKQTFHYDPSIDVHKNNVGLEQLLELYGTQNADDVFKLIKNSPLICDPVTYPIYDTHHHNIASEYNNFLVDIVCESYYSGNTFFPTEKIWRPIMLSTPFIVQGPQWFLQRLHDLGFQTFDRWWDEGYAEDPADHQPLEIIKIIDAIKTKSIDELTTMHEEMKPILEHNRKCLMNLSEEDFTKCRVDF